MMIYISCAKTMTARNRQQVPFTTIPHFEKEARENAMNMAQFSAKDFLSSTYKCNFLGADNKQ